MVFLFIVTANLGAATKPCLLKEESIVNILNTAKSIRDSRGKNMTRQICKQSLWHKCGDKFEGKLLFTHGIIFCSFCGCEFCEDDMKIIMKSGKIVRKKCLESAEKKR